MKLLLTHRFFWPDASPYGVILRSIANGLAEAGHEVHVFTSTPSYRNDVPCAPKQEQLDKLHVRRTWTLIEQGCHPVVRVANVLLYCVALFVHTLRTRPDVVTASTFPPVLAAWTASFAARLAGARFTYHMQDIHPEVSRLSGGGLGRGLPAHLLRWLDNQTLRRADAIVTLSEDMADTLRARGLRELPIHVINNFALDDFGEGGARPPAELRKAPGRQRVIFAGNLGRFQDLPRLAEGVALCLARHPGVELMFLGDGVAADELKRRWGAHPQVLFAPFLPYAQARELIRDADIGLLSLREGMYRVAYPSKLLTYLALGLPVLAVIEPDSALARLVREAGFGTVPEARTPQAIAEALEALLERPVPRSYVRAWHDAHAATGPVIERWKKLLEDTTV